MNHPTANQAGSNHLLPIGTSDFLQLRREGLRYVDNSGLITEVRRASDRILLLARPRRFGKTLALSTLAAYLERTAADSFERAERESFFQDLAVWRVGGADPNMDNSAQLRGESFSKRAEGTELMLYKYPRDADPLRIQK